MNLKQILPIAAAVATIGAGLAAMRPLTAVYASLTGLATVEDVRVVADDVKRHKVEVRMKYLQERMWDIEGYWGERFEAEKGRRHEGIEELLGWMPKESSATWRDLRAEYDALRAEMDRLDEKES